MSSYKFDMNRHSVTEKVGNSNTTKRDNSPNVVGRVFNGEDKALYESKILFEDVPLEKIVPRSINQYSQTRIDKLASSIEKTGNRLIHPIILARISDLKKDENNEIIKKFEEKGQDISSFEYVIIAGERRYRAFKMLQEKEAERQKHSKKKEANPFNTITANILTENEARKKETVFYEDSNLQSRQLTPIEAILHVDEAVKKVETDDQKRAAVDEYYLVLHPDKVVPDDEKKKLRLYKQDEYLAYYLSSELGIEGWSSSTIKTYASIVNNCDKYVIDSIVDGSYSAKAARNLPKLSKDKQIELVDLYKKCASLNPPDFKEYNDAVSTKKQTAKNVRIDYIDARKNLSKYQETLSAEIADLTKIHENLGALDQKITSKILKDLDKLNKDISEAIQMLYKNKS